MTNEAPIHTALLRGPRTRRSAAQLLAEARARVEPAHRAVIEVLPAEIRHVAGYHIGWWDAHGRPADCMGKAVRPTLTLASARAAGRLADPAEAARAAVAAAVAVELVHDFSLLHDDVMDEDLSRRHRTAAWAVFGTPRAILVGDVLLAAALQVMAAEGSAGSRSVEVLTAAVQDLAAGQSADLAFEKRGEVSLAECLAMAEGKTGALLGAACQLGAMAAGAEDGVAACYREFGRQLGLAFQLIDDVLGIWGDPKVTGKPVGSDLRARKKSLPVVAALASGTVAGEHLAWLYRRDEALDQQAVAHATRLIEQAGGRDWTAAEARRRTEAALSALTRAEPDSDAEDDLRTLAALMTRRDH
ncbi:dimethylallyltranstransferase [Parafrankia soli]|uniref:Dimethylallyltranstransferase n=1 Tax=Parafrankia soli TaxID=2599596 RepID=A0A1S1Q130_9ACTN|nr:polyprenyl synthetase family protein [Parafrankia soli]OHV27680.1 dimethylallyltranstransferase [Parafrankia soli]